MIYREGDNPARWRGNLDKLLPKPSKSRRIQHHAALPYAELPTFVEKLRRQEGSAARALEFAILTAALLVLCLISVARLLLEQVESW